MKKVVFLHIQKTAGNTVHQILFNNRMGYVALDFKKGQALTPTRLLKLKKRYPWPIIGIGGHHIDCTTPRAYFGEEQYTFTILRDPIDRYISFYNHMLLRYKYQYTFDEFLDGETQRDFQTSVIGDTRKSEDAIAILETNFDTIGIVEQMDKTMHILAADLELDIKQKALNKTSPKGLKRSDLKAEQLARAIEMNREDQKVYDYAVARLNAIKIPKYQLVEVSVFRKFVGVLLKKVSLFWVNKILD
jgi:hypothetical protein